MMSSWLILLVVSLMSSRAIRSSTKAAVQTQEYRHASHRQTWVGHRERHFAWPLGYHEDANLAHRGSHGLLGTLTESGALSTAKPEMMSYVVATGDYTGKREAIIYPDRQDSRRNPRRDAFLESAFWPTSTPPTGYTRHHSGRRVCTRRTSNSISHHHNRQIRLIYTEFPSGFSCCPGWTQVTHVSFGCNKPSCSSPCLNGGVCSAPGKCTCLKGFFGAQCENDIDECITEKPCGQICRNLPGSYECQCRPGYYLQLDGQSCRKNDSDDTAFEARDLERDFNGNEPAETTTATTTTAGRPNANPHGTENELTDTDLDQDYEIILKWLAKLEKQLARGKKKDTEAIEINGRLSYALESINEMRRTIDNVHLMQQEIYDMRSKMRQYEHETRKIHHLSNLMEELEGRLRTRCGSLLPINGGLLNF